MKKYFNCVIIVLVVVLLFGLTSSLMIGRNKKEEEPTPIDFSQLSYISFGDSKTAGSGNGSYSSFSAKNLDISYYINKAVGGGTYFDYGTERHCITNAVLNTTKHYDIVSVAGGINDCSLRTPLGQYGDKDNTTLYGCIYLICEHLNTYYKDSFCFFITPLSSKNLNCDNVNGREYKPCDIANAIIETCANYSGIKVLDLHNSVDFDYNNTLQTEDGTHPTLQYHKNILAPLVTDFIKENYK